MTNQIIIDAFSHLKEYGTGSIIWLNCSLADTEKGNRNFTIIADANKLQMGILVISNDPDKPEKTFTWDEILKALDY